MLAMEGSGSHSPVNAALIHISLTRVTSIPANILVLSREAFAGDEWAAVEQVVFEPGSLIYTISPCTFASFQSLKSICIPASVEIIGERCFVELKSLACVRFEASSKLRVLEERVFFRCGSASEAIGDEVELYWEAYDDDCESGSVPYERFRAAVTGFVSVAPSGEPICIPASVEVIRYGCFGYATYLSAVSFEPGSHLRTLGVSAFLGSTIQSIEIPPFVQVLPDNCFMFCVLLSSVTFGEGSELRSIGEAACSVSGIESMRIPRLVEVLGERCFQGCTRLLSLTFEADCKIRRLEQQAMESCTALQSICIPASVEFLGEGCFYASDHLISVTFESGSKLSVIGQGAFCHCRRLGPSIQLPSGVEVVSDSCFNNCEALSVATFEPNTIVREIEQCAFRACALISFCIPRSVVAIDWSCFSDLLEPTDITFETPSRVERISRFNPGILSMLSIPDSVESLTVTRGSRRLFVCVFGRDSRLRQLDWQRDFRHRIEGVGFMRLSELSLKKIRDNNE
jgi:hypothetical protein